ncbi:hypothetical protein BFJ72_g6861 [Fusarium proliferatum]|uniref:DUF4267 domain-containing protein n=1 Tax=Gibberella intermedia TaxID=948311 RepID=A0A420TD13_GIBIN|nr:hypothetical protein BFJ72_g6861 [Fusarium proliferatum]
MASQTNNHLPLPPILLTCTKALAIARIGIGAASFFAPQLTCASHGYHVSEPYNLLVRMMGHREAINGGLLLTAEDKEAKDGGRKSIQRALLVGLLADSLDICAVVYGFSRGEVESTTAGILGSAAAGAITLATFILRAL